MPLLPEKSLHTLPEHFWRHVLSGTIVFALGICADVFIAEIIRAQRSPAVMVHWQDNGTSPSVIPPTNRPDAAVIGFGQNGQVFWKPK